MIVTGITRTGWLVVGPLAANEVWQCKNGSVQVTVSTGTPNINDGVQLDGTDLQGLSITSGKTVRVRQIGGIPALVVREAF